MFSRPPKKIHYRPGNTIPRFKPRAFDPKVDPMLARWAVQRNHELKKAAHQMGVSLKVLRHWMRVHPELAEAMHAGNHIANAEIVQSLHDLAKGYDYKESQVEIAGKTSKQKKTKQKQFGKHHHANVHAIRLWLTNRMPDQWSAKPKPIEPTEIIARLRPVPPLPPKPDDDPNPSP